MLALSNMMIWQEDWNTNSIATYHIWLPTIGIQTWHYCIASHYTNAAFISSESRGSHPGWLCRLRADSSPSRAEAESKCWETCIGNHQDVSKCRVFIQNLVIDRAVGMTRCGRSQPRAQGEASCREFVRCMRLCRSMSARHRKIF